MTDEKYISREICELRYKKIEEDVEMTQKELEKIRECIAKKFSTLNALMYSVLTALVINLILMLIKR